MDIYSKSSGAAGALSNFNQYDFEFDGVTCASMEGLLQSFLTDDVEPQKQVCLLVGSNAKLWGAKRLIELGGTRWLWWKGERYDRHLADYQGLLDRAYDALATNQEFQATLLSTGDEVLTHSIARGETVYQTILTEEEYCSRLMSLRRQLQTLSR